ncbi:ArsR/SmtB family transcription factor [Leucobacter luti]|uniref:ArsR family transcriptional regulator n=1 Tax=Leucobacter luti TaxID=340320 RepID=A0A4Q7TK62_9MICO|nr:metalloregulator ArsR/SmtB family transcription factor [Leucobacter luti]MBL3700270.1 transcriptional regulator [Leucobacter luti]RZT61006.1 ArsR family transcriptional regulator [Leucobacter luti]
MTTAEATPAPTAACCTVGPGGGVVDDEAAHQLAKVFKALGDPTRVKLLLLIAASESGEMCACDLTEPVGLSQPTVSHHMKQLVEAGLVAREQRGKWAYYRPTTAALSAATGFLTQDERLSDSPAATVNPHSI